MAAGALLGDWGVLGSDISSSGRSCDMCIVPGVRTGIGGVCGSPVGDVPTDGGVYDSCGCAGSSVGGVLGGTGDVGGSGGCASVGGSTDISLTLGVVSSAVSCSSDGRSGGTNGGMSGILGSVGTGCWSGECGSTSDGSGVDGWSGDCVSASGDDDSAGLVDLRKYL